MALELIIEELSIASAGIYKLKRRMGSFNDILYNINPLSANFTRWSNTFKQFVDNLPMNCLSVFDHFMGLALKGLNRD